MIKIIITPSVYVYRRPESIDLTPIIGFIENEISMTLAKITMENGRVYEIKYADDKLTLEERQDALRNKEEKEEKI